MSRSSREKGWVGVSIQSPCYRKIGSEAYKHSKFYGILNALDVGCEGELEHACVINLCAQQMRFLHDCRTFGLLGAHHPRLSAEFDAIIRNIAELTQLTTLCCGWSDTVNQLFPIFALPSLEKLQICVIHGQSVDAEALRAEYAKLSRTLTFLALQGATQSMVIFLLTQASATRHSGTSALYQIALATHH